MKECSAALPVVNAAIHRHLNSKELETISWADLTADTPNCVLGTGSFGRVFQLSWQQPGGKVSVAVKLMSQTFARCANRDYAAALAMAKQEAETIHEISVRGGDAMSTHVIQVYGFVQGPLPPTLTSAFKGARAGEEAYGIVMRLESGGSLKQLLHPGPGKPNTPLSTEERIRILTLAARGLAELHRIGTIHADLKPDNILLSITSPPDVRIADFGLSKIREQMTGPNTTTTASVQRTGTIAGTKLYLAPEMLPMKPRISSGRIFIRRSCSSRLPTIRSNVYNEQGNDGCGCGNSLSSIMFKSRSVTRSFSVPKEILSASKPIFFNNLRA